MIVASTIYQVFAMSPTHFGHTHMIWVCPISVGRLGDEDTVMKVKYFSSRDCHFQDDEDLFLSVLAGLECSRKAASASRASQAAQTQGGP